MKQDYQQPNLEIVYFEEEMVRTSPMIESTEYEDGIQSDIF